MRKRWRRAALASGLHGPRGRADARDRRCRHRDHGVPGRGDSHDLVAGNPTVPGRNGGRRQHQDRRQSAQRRATTTDGSRITARGGNPDAFSWELVDDDVDVEAVIVKGGRQRDTSTTTARVRESDSGSDATAQQRWASRADQPCRVLLRSEGRAGSGVDGGEDRQRHIAGRAQLGDRQAGEGRRRLGRDVRRQRALLNLPDGGNGSFTWKVDGRRTRRPQTLCRRRARSR